jgi:hypothetical protein
MTSPLDDELRDLLARRAAVDRRDVGALRAYVAVLPPRRRGRRGLLAAAAGIALLLSVGGLLLPNLRFGSSGAAPAAPNPAAFAFDPRLAVCGVSAKDATAIFELVHLRDYPLQLPAAFELQGLDADADAPALVIVRNGPGSPDRRGSPAPGGSHDLCLVVGADAASWKAVTISGVDTTGLMAYRPEPTGTPIAEELAPWAERCGGAGAGILAVVRFDHASDLASSLVLDPAPPELAGDGPGAVIVYDGAHPFSPLGSPPAAGGTVAPREPLAEGHHDLCVLSGGDAATAALAIHEDVAVRFVGPAGASPEPSP